MHIFFKVLALLPFYLIGAIPSGYLVSKKYGINISDHGSGNVGATNVARILGKRPGLLTLGLDVLKGIFALTAASIITNDQDFISFAAIAVICGHCFSVPGFKGGKGVATALGISIFYSLLMTVACLAIFALLFYLTRYVSLASVIAVSAAPIISLLANFNDATSIALICVSLIVTYRHKDNLSRLAEGREPKFKSF